VPPEVLRACEEELLRKSLFQAVFAATMGVSERLRQERISGDGAGLAGGETGAGLAGLVLAGETGSGAIQALWPMMALVSRNSSKPNSPHSRPLPDWR
jgi:hypothetical protein